MVSLEDEARLVRAETKRERRKASDLLDRLVRAALEADRAADVRRSAAAEHEHVRRRAKDAAQRRIRSGRVYVRVEAIARLNG